MPRARLGQHFLTDNRIARRIVDAVQISQGDVIIEIGPGTGSLTRHIVPVAQEQSAKVILIEVDGRLSNDLDRRYGQAENVQVLSADFRDVDLATLSSETQIGALKVVGNLPYYAGTPIVRHVLESERKANALVVMLQREVASEMVARPGRMSLLSLAVQVYAAGEVIFDVDPSAFNPRPQVHSSVLRLTPFKQARVAPPLLDAMFQLARVCFRGKRKQIHNSLASGLGMDTEQSKALGASAGLDTTRRPATLSIEEWESLARTWIATRSTESVG